MRIWGEGICSDAARRVAIKGAASFMRISRGLISGCGRQLDHAASRLKTAASRLITPHRAYNLRAAFNATVPCLKKPCLNPRASPKRIPLRNALKRFGTKGFDEWKGLIEIS